MTDEAPHPIGPRTGVAAIAREAEGPLNRLERVGCERNG